MPYVSAGDSELHYQVSGRGAPLLLLGPLGGSADLWGGAFVEQLAQQFRVIVPDHRGTGRSDRGQAPYTMDRLAEDAAAVLDREGVLTASVLGASLGGMVALELAGLHPSRVRALVLAATSAGGPGSAPWRAGALEEIKRDGLMAAASLLVTPAYTAQRTGLISRLTVRQMAQPPVPGVLQAQHALVTGFNFSARLPLITPPTLVMTGEHDRLTPPENARHLARAIRAAQGIVVRDAGHCFWWEAPERATAAIAEFLSAHSRQAERDRRLMRYRAGA